MRSTESLWHVDLGQQTEETATIRVGRSSLPSATIWRGALRGPYCRYARTLAADYPVDPDGVAVVPEPCYWSPSLPFLYRLCVEAVVDDTVIQSVSQSIGLRRLDAHDGHLYWEGRRTVLRGVRVDTRLADQAGGDASATRLAALLSEAREAGAALWINGYDAEACRLAAEIGTPLIVDLTTTTGDVPSALLSAALMPAVVATIVDQCPAEFDSVGAAALLARAIRLDTPAQPPPWAKVAIVVMDAPDTLLRWVADLELPILAACPAPLGVSLIEGRGQADRLQAALAPQFDFAGYFV